MKRKLIIDGNAVYEVDEDCMLGRCLEEGTDRSREVKSTEKMTDWKRMSRAEQMKQSHES
jgi:adenylate kinase